MKKLNADRVWAHTVRHLARTSRKRGLKGIPEKESAWLTPTRGIRSLLAGVSHMYAGSNTALSEDLKAFYEIESATRGLKRVSCPGWVHEALYPMRPDQEWTKCPPDDVLEKLFFLWILGSKSLRKNVACMEGQVLLKGQHSNSLIPSFIQWVRGGIRFPKPSRAETYAAVESRLTEIFSDSTWGSSFPLGFPKDSPLVRFLNAEPVDVDSLEDGEGEEGEPLEFVAHETSYQASPHALFRFFQRHPSFDVPTPKAKQAARELFVEYFKKARRVYRRNVVSQIIKHDFEVAKYRERHGWIFVISEKNVIKTCYFKGKGKKKLRAAGYKASPW